MKFKRIHSIILLASFFLISCSIEAEQISYGKDQCNFCSMNIVDKTHAAQYVTKKGKQFKFDAIECMMNDIIRNNKKELSIILVSDFLTPGQMIDAKNATYIISKEIKSPMGANLSALSSKENGKDIKNTYSGILFSWDLLKKRYIKKNS